MFKAWRSGRSTGPIISYAIVEEDASGRLDAASEGETEEDDSDDGVGHHAQRLDPKSQAWIHRRLAAFAFVATLALTALACVVFQRQAPPPRLPRQSWRAGIGRPRYSLEDEEKSLNPYAVHLFYQSPLKKAEYETSIRSSKGLVHDRLKTMREVATAVWVDSKAMLRGRGWSSLEGTLKDASWKVTAQLVTIVMHNLPNRDCGAEASSAEICCARFANGTCDLDAQDRGCDAGIREYKEEFVDPFVEVLQKYKGAVPMVVVVEPFALPRYATGGNGSRCGGAATRSAYREGLRYALDQLVEKAPWVSIYLDAAHGGWLGWHELTVRYLSVVKELGLPYRNIRGFATNIANYQPLGKAACPWSPSNRSNAYCLGAGADSSCCEDPCGALLKGNPANNELNYAQELVRNARDILGVDAHVLIDTSRNGQAAMRSSCENTCNVRKAGAGHASTAKVHPSAASFVDAYFWIKSPGESDGCAGLLPSGQECSHRDQRCASEDSLGFRPGEPPAPEAGEWFDYQARQLAKHADLGLNEEAEALISMREQEEDLLKADLF